MLKGKLLKLLTEYENTGKTLIVKWNAGGDETIVNYFCNEVPLGYHSFDFLEELRIYLVEEFNLPNAGEYYNDGRGKFSIVNEDEILFEFDEYAYFENYEGEIESEMFEETFTVNFSNKKFLEEYSLLETNFYGSISFLQEREHEELQMDISGIDEDILNDKLKTLNQVIKKYILSKFDPPFQDLEINYSGKITIDKIIIDEFYRIKYTVDKNRKNEKKYLFK